MPEACRGTPASCIQSRRSSQPGTAARGPRGGIYEIHPFSANRFGLAGLPAGFHGHRPASAAFQEMCGTPPGLVVPGSKIVVTNSATAFRQEVETDSSGQHSSFQACRWALTLCASNTSRGSKQPSSAASFGHAASSRSLVFTLEVGQVTDSGCHTAAAEQVQTTSGNVGRVINEQQLSQIALNGREYILELLRLVPGVVATTLNVFNPQLALNQQVVNGIRTQSSYFLVDGAENHDNGANSNGLVDPNVDAIAEVKLDTSSYAAEFGGRAGATINLVTKSGTRDFHGTLFEFVRNDAFDARLFFAPSVDPLRFNDFGGTIGGPVYIPRKFNTSSR